MTVEPDISPERVLENVRRFYSEGVIDHAMNPRNVGRLPEADGFASDSGDCGDRFEIWIRVRDGRIAEARFWTDGCAAQIACGSMVTELVRGKPVGEAFQLGAQDIIRALGGLPEENAHCAVRAAAAVKSAINNHLGETRPLQAVNEIPPRHRPGGKGSKRLSNGTR